jgi:hypothetical protein
MDIKILIVTHKKYEIPDDDIYFPLHVGNINHYLGYTKDNTGENISDKNLYYCELTGLYWAWKNLSCEYMGLVHYRRYFSDKPSISKILVNRFNKIIKINTIKKLLNKSDIILPKQRNYFIESLYSHYKHTMYIEPLDETFKIIYEKYPYYIGEIEKLKERKSAHMFNMFIMKKEIMDEYCEWLFEILFELEKRIDVSKYDSFHGRFFGRISELLLDVWINTNQLSYIEVPIIDMENVNWIMKIYKFLKAKFNGTKYDKSF